MIRAGIAIVAAALVACTPAARPVVTAPPSVDPFSDGRLDTYAFTVADEDWRRLVATAREERYVPAILTVSGERVGTVGLRFKGSWGTLHSCFDAATGTQRCPKASLKVKFDEYQRGKRHRGLARVNLHSMVRDPSALHERLAYDLFRRAGIPAPRAVHAQVTINGRYHGLHALVEAIDRRFVTHHWPAAADGNLYKERWPLADDPSDQGRKGKRRHDGILAFGRALRTAAPVEVPAVLERWVGWTRS